MRAAFVVAGVLLSACTVMDGEGALLDAKKQTDTKEEDSATKAEDTHVESGSSNPTPQSSDAATPPLSKVVVECGDTKCEGATPFCCASSSGATCVDAKTVTCPANQFFMACDDPSDCTNGDVCCQYWKEATHEWRATCMPGNACPVGRSTDPEGWAIMCFSDTDCPDDGTCTADTTDWADLHVTLRANTCEWSSP